MSRKHSRRRGVYVLWFVLYTAVLIYFLFFAEKFGRGTVNSDYHYNLTLFNTIKLYVKGVDAVGFWISFLNIAGNIIAFVPFGVLVPAIFVKRLKSFPTVLLLGFLLSLGVEVVQLLTRVGTFDVDDVLLNTIGVALGYVVYLIEHYIRFGRR